METVDDNKIFNNSELSYVESITSFYKSKGFDVLDERESGGFQWVFGDENEIRSLLNSASRLFGDFIFIFTKNEKNGIYGLKVLSEAKKKNDSAISSDVAIKAIFTDVFSKSLVDIVMKEKNEQIKAVLGSLTTQELNMLLMRYQKQMTLEQIGGYYQISKERVRQLINKSIKKLGVAISPLFGIEIIENNASKKKRKAEFNIDDDKLEYFEFSSTPLTISEITKRINALRKNGTKILSTTVITDWLVKNNILEIVNIDNKGYKRPTDNTQKIGLAVEQRSGEKGNYYVVVYNENAQKYIIDNIKKIIDD